MKRIIEKPNKVNHKLYIWLIIAFLIGVIISFTRWFQKNEILEVIADAIRNLSYGCVASTVVAWLIDCANVRTLNKKANDIYDDVYLDLKCNIAYFLETWANMCAVAFKQNDYYKEMHTWNEWYVLTKKNFNESEQKRKDELIEFFCGQLQQSMIRVQETIIHINSQEYALVINGMMNSDVRSIISDFRFEFYALELSLSGKVDEEQMWNYMDAIVKDLDRYIANWKDIKHYNCVKFYPYDFFGIIKSDV